MSTYQAISIVGQNKCPILRRGWEALELCQFDVPCAGVRSTREGEHERGGVPLTASQLEVH